MMAGRELISAACFLLALATEALADTSSDRTEGVEAPLIAVVIKDMTSERRVFVSVTNVRSSNIQLIKAIDHAINLGDAVVSFERSGIEYRKDGYRSQLIPELVGWFPGGQGFVQAKKKAVYTAAFGLLPGCYQMKVVYSNHAARKATAATLAGPTTRPAVAVAKVCFDEKDVAAGRELSNRP